MDPLEPWIDASAVRRLAERLMTEPADSEVEAGPDAGFGSEFVGFAEKPVAAGPPPEPPQPQEPPALAREVPAPEPPALAREEAPAPEPPALAREEAPPKVFEPVALVREASVPDPVPPPLPPAASGRGPLLDRLARFRDALIRHTGAQGVFILDREGKPVMEDAAFGKLHFLARSLAQAYRPVSGQAGNVHVKIGANSVLEVVPVETPFGCLVLGAVVPRPLTAAAVAEIAQALGQAATPPDNPPA